MLEWGCVAVDEAAQSSGWRVTIAETQPLDRGAQLSTATVTAVARTLAVSWSLQTALARAVGAWLRTFVSLRFLKALSLVPDPED